MQVIIFVVLAIALFSFSFFPKRILPFSPSIKTAALADKSLSSILLSFAYVLFTKFIEEHKRANITILLIFLFDILVDLVNIILVNLINIVFSRSIPYTCLIVIY